MDIRFTPATEKDIALITQLAQKIWHQHYPGIITIEQINYMLSNRYSAEAIGQQIKGGEQFYLAYEGNTPIAYGSVQLQTNFYYLHKFYVDVAKHRAGIGKGFFDYLLTQTGSTKPIKLQVNRLNYKAINFYFKNGFVITRAEDFDIGNGYFMTDFVMERHH